MAKRFLIPIVACSLILSACNSTRQLGSYTDDVYTNVGELKLAAKKQAEEQANRQAAEQQRLADSAVAQKARDDANPYYKDPSYSKDDYYDYEYASRINRFGNPISGAGYYDNYYTNMYTYNQNPAYYGTSIYSSYNYMPSAQFGMMSAGFGNSFYNGYSLGYNNYYSPYYNSFGYTNYYSPYSCYCGGGFYNTYYGGYNSGFYNPYYSTGFYSGYNAGYYNGYYGNSYYNSGWGYLNTYDPNSGYSNMEHTPRPGSGSRGSANGASRNAGGGQNMGGRQQLYEAYSQQQNNTPRFSNVGTRATRATGGMEQRSNSNSNGNYNNALPNQQSAQPNYNNRSRQNSNEGQRATRRENNTRTNSNENNSTNRSMNENNSWNNNNNSGGGFNNGGGNFTPRNSGGNMGGGNSGGGRRTR